MASSVQKNTKVANRYRAKPQLASCTTLQRECDRDVELPLEQVAKLSEIKVRLAFTKTLTNTHRSKKLEDERVTKLEIIVFKREA